MVSVPRLYEKIYATVHNAQENASPLKKRLFQKAIETGTAYHTACHNRNGENRPVSPWLTLKFKVLDRPLPDCEVRLSEEGEVMVRGGQVMKGYFNNPEKTAEAIVDGWFKTGDIGAFDRDGFRRITDRIKELIITSGGKNIAPQHIETLVGKDYFIEQIVAIGDRRKFISALVVPAMEALETWARDRGITWSSVEELINRSDVLALYRRRIDMNSEKLARFETIKKFTLLPRPFTVETGEITPTLKFKRKQISEKYFALIEAMYRKADA